MSNPIDFVDGNNRVRNNLLSKYAVEKSAFNFVYDVPYPFFIGKKLLEGDLFKQSLETNNTTYRFLAEELSVDLETAASTAITKAIYLICKNQFIEQKTSAEDEDPNAITMGRSSENDITINDYAISKKHARITKKQGRYYISDAGSTNGVAVNEQKLSFGESVLLTPKCTVNFGRFSFLFVHPLEVYYRIIASTRDEIPTRDDLMKIAREADTETLRQISQDKRSTLPSNARKTAILNHMSSKLTENQIIDWLYHLPI